MRCSAASSRNSSNRLISARGEVLVREVREGRTPPHRECVLEHHRRGGGVVAHQAASLSDGGFEALGVERIGFDLQDVPVVAGEQHAALAAFGAGRFQRRPQPRDVDPQGLLLAGGVVAPELLEDPVGGHDTVGAEQQEREQRPLLVRPEVDGCTVGQGLERTEDSELHGRPSSHASGLARNLTVDQGQQSPF